MATRTNEVGVLTLAQTCRYLQLSERTVRDMLQRGELPGTKPARAWRIPREALDRYLNERALSEQKQRQRQARRQARLTAKRDEGDPS